MTLSHSFIPYSILVFPYSHSSLFLTFLMPSHSFSFLHFFLSNSLVYYCDSYLLFLYPQNKYFPAFFSTIHLHLTLTPFSFLLPFTLIPSGYSLPILCSVCLSTICITHTLSLSLFPLPHSLSSSPSLSVQWAARVLSSHLPQETRGAHRLERMGCRKRDGERRIYSHLLEITLKNTNSFFN